MSSPADQRPLDSEALLRREAQRICEGLLCAYVEASQRCRDQEAEVARLIALLRDLEVRIVRAMS